MGFARSVPFIFVHNFGRIITFANSIAFDTGAGTDLIQEAGGILELGSFTGATLNGKVLVKQGSTVFGEAMIREAIIEGEAHGRLSFQILTLAPTAISKFELSGPQGSLSTTQNLPLALAGQLQLGSLRGLIPGPNDQFEIVRANAGTTGQFAGADFGKRVQLPGGTGSLLLTRSADSQAIRLGSFLPPPVVLDGVPLNFRMPDAVPGVGGCFVVPHPAIDLPVGNWAGGSLRVEFTDGLNLAFDRLEYRRNPQFPEADEIVFEGLPEAEQTVRFRGAAFGTARIKDGRMIATLNAQAQNEAIVALLGRLYYANTQLTGEWFKRSDARYSSHTIAVTLTDSTGNEETVSRPVDFPFLIGLKLEDSLLLPAGEQAVLHLQGRFSNAQILPVPFLAADWSESCHNQGVLAAADLAFPGIRTVVSLKDTNGVPIIPYCCAVYAGTGAMFAGIDIYEGVRVRLKLEDLAPLERALVTFFGDVGEVIDTAPGNCALIYQLIYRYQVKSCETSSANRGARLATDTGLATLPPPTTFYALEDLMKGTSGGQHWVDLYRQYSAEVVGEFILHPNLLIRAQELIAAFHPGVAALLAGQGDTVFITPPMITQLNAFWNLLAQHASPALKTVLEQEQARFRGFELFQGVTFAHWAGVLGLPIPSQPRVYISLTRRDANRFRLGLNDIPGADFVLWRSLDLHHWESVPNATVERDGASMLYTDPAPSVAAAYYELTRSVDEALNTTKKKKG